jgi:uncharacterized protein YqjF (DUF2071 family)
MAAIRFGIAALLYDLGMTVMRQSWLDVAFLHWRYDPAIVRPLVPRGLELDLYDGAAWVGLVPFTIEGLTLPHAPAVPYLSNFPETNVRTYATDRTGGAGVWFFSLDAARLLAVVGARVGYGLPYFWSRMRVETDGHGARYRSRRRQGPPASSNVEVRIGGPIAGQSDLEIFLTARFRLYAERAGRIWKADIAHPPWPLQEASVVTIEETLVCAAGLPAPRGEALAHYAKRVDVQVGPPLPL